ncbi:MAG: ABC transporter permease subunit, partial [Kangiellaceae bacterium]|nr:ABC transporter permease subunit [Kangiellaceae bacterium]
VKYFAVSTLTTAVYDTWLGYGDLTAAARISSLMLVFIFILIAIEKLGHQKRKYYQKSTGQSNDARKQLSGREALIVLSFLILVFTASFLFPFLTLAKYAIEYFEQSWNNQFLEYSFNSLFVAILVSLICLFIGLLLAYFKRLSVAKSSAIPGKLSSTGYALPGTVLAIGVLVPLTLLDYKINDIFEYFELPAPGLIFSGSLFAIVFAYVVRFSAISVGAIESSLTKVSPSIDMVSATMGISPLKRMFKIHLPLVKKGLLAATTLVFIESMKELPAALLLRPFGFETLATHVYQFVSDEQLELAALSAIVIVFVGLIPVILLNRFLEQGR